MGSPVEEIKKIINTAKADGNLIDLQLSGVKFDRFTPEIAQLIEREESLEVLILTGCGLITLEGFPKNKFQALELSSNKLGDNSSIETLASYADLTQIFLNNNNIKQLQTIMSLKDLQRLIEVDFSENPVSKNANYPKEIFEKFACIEFVDRKDKDGKQIEDEEEGEFDDDDDEDEYDGEEEDEDYSDDEDEYQEESDEKPKRGRGRKRGK